MKETLSRHALEQEANESGTLQWRVQSEFRAPYEVEKLSRFICRYAASGHPWPTSCTPGPGLTLPTQVQPGRERP